MPKPLIALHCTARELESRLHAVCDHEGMQYGEVRIVCSLNP